MAALYTPELLTLAVELADHPLDPARSHRAQARSRICGGSLELDANLDRKGAIAAVGLRAHSCAVGQAAAALFARSAVGRTRASLIASREALEIWLSSSDRAPDWPDIEHLAAAIGHPGRHGAIVLAWTAAIEALSNPGTAG